MNPGWHGMIKRKIIASVFLIIAIVLGAIFYREVSFPVHPEEYFKVEYYTQFGPLAICIELFIAGLYLLM